MEIVEKMSVVGRFRNFALLCTLICERRNQDQCVEYYYCTKKPALVQPCGQFPFPLSILVEAELEVQLL